jgi:hypothetical protein
VIVAGLDPGLSCAVALRDAATDGPVFAKVLVNDSI